MENSAEVIEVLTAIGKAKKMLKPIKKTKSSADGVYNYVTLDDVLSNLKDILPKCKLGFIQQIEAVENRNELVTTVFHTESGQYITSRAIIPFEKDDFLSIIQQVGASITYMRRYTLCTIFGIVAEDDTDGAVNVKAGSASVKVQNYSDVDKELIRQRIKAKNLSESDRKIINEMVLQNCKTEVILKRIDSMK